MDSKHLSALLMHNENETKPKCVPLEHWIPNKDGKRVLLHKGHVFNETMDLKELNKKHYFHLTITLERKESNAHQTIAAHAKTNM